MSEAGEKNWHMSNQTATRNQRRGGVQTESVFGKKISGMDKQNFG